MYKTLILDIKCYVKFAKLREICKIRAFRKKISKKNYFEFFKIRLSYF